MKRIVFIAPHDLLKLISELPEWGQVAIYRAPVWAGQDFQTIVASRHGDKAYAKEVADLLRAPHVTDPRDLFASGVLRQADEVAWLAADEDLSLRLIVMRKLKTL